MSRARHLLLALLCACGKLSGADVGVGALPDGAGAACMVDAGALALVLQSPPACTPDPDGGFFNAACEQWADSLVSGAHGLCNGGLCTFGIGATCIPGPDGDAQCQGFFQSCAKTSYAYAKCQGAFDAPGAATNFCVSADRCTGDYNIVCTCGATPKCKANGELCLNVGGTPTCANVCE